MADLSLTESSTRIAVRIVYLFSIAVTVLFHTAEAFNLTECKDAIEEHITQNPNATKDNDLFWGEDKLQPRYKLCEDLCGGGNNTIVGDCGPRLTAWVLPVLILVGSMKLPPLAWQHKLWAVLRLSGDPMGSQCRMVDELRLYQQCIREGDRTAAVLRSYISPGQVSNGKIVTTSTSTSPINPDEQGRRNLAGNCARIIHAFSKSIGGQSPLEARLYLETGIHEMAKRDDWKPVLDKFREQVDKSGKAFIQQKSSSTFKPLLAVSLFVIPVIISLVPQVAKVFASGAMMASILTLSPFILMVFLSNSIGEYLSLEELSAELGRVMESIPPDTREYLPVGSLLYPSINKDDPDILEYSRLNLYPSVDKDITSLLKYSGLSRRGSSVRGNGKESLISRVKRHIRIHPLSGILLLVFPLGIALAGIAIGTRPTFFQVRHVLLIMVFVGWVFSWWATYSLVDRYIVRNPPRGKRVAWTFLAVTHLLVAISGPIFLAGITCGLLGGCKMWSGYYWYGAQEARMQFNIDDSFERNGKVLYPALTGICLGLNVFVFFVLRYWVFRRVFRVIAGQDDKIMKKKSNVEIGSEAVETRLEVVS